MKNFSLYIFLLLFILQFPGLVTRLMAQNTVQNIIGDMTLAPDAALHGTESLSWGTGEASPQPMYCPVQNYKGEWMRAATQWGQVYIPRTGSQATNTRCQIRNLCMKILLTDGTWSQVQSGDPEGSAYKEDFANNSAIPANIRSEANNEGGVSVIVGIGAWAGYNFHFWPKMGRSVIDVNNIVAVFTSCEARLIQDDSNKPDDRTLCKNLLQSGADWWLNLSIGWLPDWSANFGIGVGRAKWVTSEWQTFNMCTLPTNQIINNPPIESSAATDVLEAENTSLIVYPNPAKGNQKLAFSVGAFSSVSELTIYASDGKLIYQKKFEALERSNPIDPNLRSGIYVVRFSCNGFSASTRLLVE